MPSKLPVGELVRFASFSLREGLSWYGRHGRVPRGSELYDLLQKAVWRFKLAVRRPQSASKLLERPVLPYEAWLAANRWNQRAREELVERLQRNSVSLPRISIVMPVHDPPVAFLDRAVASVRAQVLDQWELCIADDCSTNGEVKAALARWSSENSRIKVTFLEQNHNISAATNAAVCLATGEFLLFLDHDDELSPDAVAEVALYLAQHPGTDLLYSDDDKINMDGKRYAPQFKPNWSPELLLAYMYFSHVLVVRRSLFVACGGMRVGFEGAQDYDLALRVSERTSAIGHLPKILYHWRALPGSTACSGAEKPASLEAGRRAVGSVLERRHIAAKVSQPKFAAEGHLGIYRLEFPDDGPSVTIVIPTKNHVSILRRCIESLKATTYRNYEIVVIDNESDEPETVDYLKTLPHRVLRIPNPPGGFNFAAINNRAVQAISSDFILFLNNDTAVQRPRWLSQMVGYAQLPGVGAVGAKLIFPDGRIQHAGIVHGYYHGLAGPAFKLAAAFEHGYLAYASVSRNYSAVTAACLLTPRRLFLDQGGFNEKDFKVAYNDVDYCYRIVDRGYRCVYCPDAELIHYEGYSRGFRDDPSEVATFKRMYGSRQDPWYSPHLSLADERFSIVPRRIGSKPGKPIPTVMTALNLNCEGAPWSQYELTVELSRRRVIEPIVFSPQDGPLRSLYEEHGIPVIIDRHPLWGVTNLKEYEDAITAFTSKCLSWGAELLYANTLQSFYAIDAAERSGIPSLWNLRESEPWQTYFDYLPERVNHRAYRCFGLPYRVVFVSDATRQAYTALDTRHNFTVVRNGLNLSSLEQARAHWPRENARASLGLSERDVMLLLLGTVCNRKGQHDLLHAVRALSSKTCDRLHCYIVGDRRGEYSSSLHVLRRKLPPSKRQKVHVVSETRETARYYQAADIFLCTSRLESYPRVVLEAMAYRLPLITTPVFGIREQVREGYNAVFYEPGDVTKLVGHIEAMVGDDERRRRMAMASDSVSALGTDFDAMATAYGEILVEAWLTGGRAA